MRPRLGEWRPPSRGGKARYPWVDEGAASRSGDRGLVQGTPIEQLLPAQEPVGPAVVPAARPRAADDRDRVAWHLHLLVELRFGWRHVDAAVAHVREVLHADRP